VRDDEHGGVVGCGVERGQEAAGVRHHDVRHTVRAVGQGVLTARPQRRDAPGTPLGRDVAALREQHEGAVVREVTRDPGDRLGGAVLAPPAPRGRRDEGGRQPVQQHVDRRVPLQRVLEDDGGGAPRPAQQGVEQDERVPGAGVPAHDDERGVGQGGAVGRLHDDPQPQCPAHLPEQDAEHDAGEDDVRVLHPRPAHPQAEPGGDPQDEQPDERHRVPHDVDAEHPQQAQHPEPAGQHPGEGGADDEREHDGRGHQRHGDQHDDGREQQAARPTRGRRDHRARPAPSCSGEARNARALE
jgi:hypothetical protein